MNAASSCRSRENDKDEIGGLGTLKESDDEEGILHLCNNGFYSVSKKNTHHSNVQTKEICSPGNADFNRFEEKRSTEVAVTEDSCSLWSEPQLKDYFPKLSGIYDTNDNAIQDDSVVVLADGAVIFAQTKNDIDTDNGSNNVNSFQIIPSFMSRVLEVRKYFKWFVDDCLLRPFWYASTALTLILGIIGFGLNIVAHKSPSFLTLPKHRKNGLMPGDDSVQAIHKFGLFFMRACGQNWNDDNSLSHGPFYEIVAPDRDQSELEAAAPSGLCHLERIDGQDMNDSLWEVSRIASSLGLMFGACAILGLLACFLSRRINLRAIAGFSIFAYLAQNFTFMVFGSNICRDEVEGKISCKMSTGAFFGMASAASWFAASTMIVYMWYVRNKSPELYDFMNDKGNNERHAETDRDGKDNNDDKASIREGDTKGDMRPSIFKESACTSDAHLYHASTWTSTDTEEDKDVIHVEAMG